MKRRLDAAFHLLDRQIVAADGRPAGKVDDLELTPPPDDPAGAPRVTALVCGRRKPATIDFGVIKRIGAQVEVSLPTDDLPVGKAEAAVWDKGVSHLPGARRHAGS